MSLLLLLLACEPRGLDPELPVPDFELVDQNPSSALSGQTVSPSDYEGQVSAWYFGSSSCPYCVSQAVHLWDLQQALWSETDLDITLHSVNPAGYEAWNAAAVASHDLPWLQDREDQDVWGAWDPLYRDVIIVDPSLRPVSTYNLSTYDLAEAENVEALRELLEAAAD